MDELFVKRSEAYLAAIFAADAAAGRHEFRRDRMIRAELEMLPAADVVSAEVYNLAVQERDALRRRVETLQKEEQHAAD